MLPKSLTGLSLPLAAAILPSATSAIPPTAAFAAKAVSANTADESVFTVVVVLSAFTAVLSLAVAVLCPEQAWKVAAIAAIAKSRLIFFMILSFDVYDNN